MVVVYIYIYSRVFGRKFEICWMYPTQDAMVANESV